MRNRLYSVVLCATAAALGGCGWLTGSDGLFRDRQNDYREATATAPLELPSGIDGAAINTDMAVPGTAGGVALSGEFEVPRPEPLSGNPGAELVKIQKLGDARWILVEAIPGEVWPRIRQFLTASQLDVGRLDAQAGIIETGWLQPQGDGARERYRFRIEQGIQRNSSEVYVLQASAGAGDSWPDQSTRPEREAEMVSALAQFIADQGSSGAVSMIAQRALDAQGRVFLERQPQQLPTLRLALPFARSWASLEAALPGAGFVVDDRNFSAHQLWVRYAPDQVDGDKDDDDNKRGWFSSLWGGDDDAALDSDIVYLVSVEELGDDQVRISLRRQDDGQLTASQAETLLLRIKSNLS